MSIKPPENSTMTKPEDIAERLYAKLGRGSSADIEAIRAAILSAVEEEREHLRKFLNVSPSDPYSLADLQTEQIKRLEGERA